MRAGLAADIGRLNTVTAAVINQVEVEPADGATDTLSGLASSDSTRGYVNGAGELGQGLSILRLNCDFSDSGIAMIGKSY